MHLKELEYIVRIAEEQNLTRAAEKLFITPSALTQQLLHLEEEIGTPLFYRSRSGCIPTEAGEIYLETAREMLMMKREAYNRLQDISATKKGTLSIGFPPERGTSMFTSVYPEFHRKYPDITMNVYEVNVRRQQQMIAKGTLDLGFLTLSPHQKTNDEYVLISSEEILLAVPSEHPCCQLAIPSASGSHPELDLQLLKHEPFALMYKESTVRELMDTIFRKAGFVPTVLFEAARSHTTLSMVSARLCCALVPENSSQEEFPGASFFSLPEHPSWELVASYRKRSYLSRPARYFLELATSYWQDTTTAVR